MPVTAEIRTLKNADGTLIVYPETTTQGIYSPSLSTNLEEGFFSSALVYDDPDNDYSPTAPVSANVSGIKGAAEVTYRTGAVSINAANILGSTAIGSNSQPVYWNGSAFVAANGGAYVSKAGDSLTGGLSWTNTDSRVFNISAGSTQQNVDIGWSYSNQDGAGIGLRSADFTGNNPGGFLLYARNATNTFSLNGTITGDLSWSGSSISLTTNTASLSRQGTSTSWYSGRDFAMVRQTTYSGYSPIVSCKTTNGAWSIGPYSNDILYFSYVTDTDYNNRNNVDNHNVNIRPDGKLYGAVWNDYVEYREGDNTEPGYVMIETGLDTITKSTERLQPFAGVVSDTFGFAIGETKKCQTPIAVSGRVLVYTYRSRDEYKPGDCVCTAANGTVDIMTREEIQQYPDRIVGVVSAVPQYQTWGQDKIPVNKRIWIKVR